MKKKGNHYLKISDITDEKKREKLQKTGYESTMKCYKDIIRIYL